MRKKVLQLISGNVLNAILSGLLSIYVARVLGPERRGILALAMGSALVASTFFNFGVPHAAAFFIRHKPESAKKILDYLNVTLITSLALSALLFYIGQGLFSRIFLGGYRMDAFILSLLVGIIFVNSGNIMIGASIIAKGDSVRYATALNIGTISAFFVTFIMFTLTKWQLHGALAGYLVGQTVTTIMFRLIFSGYVEHTSQSQGNELRWREFFGYGLKAQIGSVASLAFKRLDLFIVGYFLNTAAVGYYAIALSLRDIALIAPRSMAGLIGGEMTDRQVKESGSAIQLYRKGILSSIAFSVAACLIAFLSFPYLIPLVYGHAYKDAIIPASVIFLSLIPLSVAIIINPAIGAYGRPMLMSIGNVISSSLGFIGIWFLTKYYGIIGASVSAVTACLILVIVNSIIFHLFVQGTPSSDATVRKSLLKRGT